MGDGVTGSLYASVSPEDGSVARHPHVVEVSDAGGDIEISGRRYDDPDLPDVSLSPAMTVHGIEAGDTVERAD